MTDIVTLRIRGLMPEKLIERAREQGVRFLAIQPLGDHAMTAAVSAKDAEKLTALCARFSIPCEVLSRRGKSALAAWLRQRWTLLIGLLIAVAACHAFLTHVWRVDIRFVGDAAEQGDATAIVEWLDASGIRPGIPRGIDTKLLSEDLLANCAGISYAGVRLEGVRLLVEVSPEAAAPEVYDVDASRDLYADRPGIVVSVNVEAGEPCVKPGDTVRRGQLLIRGAEQVDKESTRAIAALGEVVIRAWFEGSAEGRLTAETRAYTGQVSTSSTLVTPWRDFPITGGEVYESQVESTDALPIGGLYLPVKIERVTRRATRTERVEVDRDRLRARLAALAMADARSKLSADGPKKYEIARCWTREESITGDTLRICAVCEITTNTAVTIETLRQGG